jgi:hypothetical protein
MTYVTLHRDYTKHLKLWLNLQAYGKGAFARLGYSLPEYPAQNTYTLLSNVKTYYLRRTGAGQNGFKLFRDSKMFDLKAAFHHSSYGAERFARHLTDLCTYLQPLLPENFGSFLELLAIEGSGKQEGHVSVAITQAVHFKSSEATRIPDQVISASADFGKNRRCSAEYSAVCYKKVRGVNANEFDICYGKVAVSIYYY